MVTSWNWVYLTDFSSCIKPVYLPDDNPTNFSIFFDASARRSCYVAPERFISTNQIMEHETLTPEMDIFSLGYINSNPGVLLLNYSLMELHYLPWLNYYNTETMNIHQKIHYQSLKMNMLEK